MFHKTNVQVDTVLPAAHSCKDKGKGICDGCLQKEAASVFVPALLLVVSVVECVTWLPDVPTACYRHFLRGCIPLF